MIVVPVSGGKDSQLCLQLAVESHGPNNVKALFCDTQFEHPTTYSHIEFMAAHYGVRIEVVSGGSVLEKVLKHKRFPSGVARFCTDELKMKVSRDWYKTTAATFGAFDVWYGMRTGESKPRAQKYASYFPLERYAPHEMFPEKYPKHLAKSGVYFVLPILGLTTHDVVAALGKNINPLYKAGFDRVGCFPCLAAGAKTMAKAFAFDSFGHSQAIAVGEIGKLINKNPMSPVGSPCSLCLI